jgi:hypothetical protein
LILPSPNPFFRKDVIRWELQLRIS